MTDKSVKEKITDSGMRQRSNQCKTTKNRQPIKQNCRNEYANEITGQKKNAVSSASNETSGAENSEKSGLRRLA